MNYPNGIKKNKTVILNKKIDYKNRGMNLENDINEFLSCDNIDVVDIKYQVGVSVFSDEQIYCFLAMIIYSNFE